MEATALVSPDRLWSAQEVLVRPSPVPATAGIYGWHFEQPPHPDWSRPLEWCIDGHSVISF